MSFSKEVAGDNEDEGDDDVVKKISSFTSFEPPPLERKKDDADQLQPKLLSQRLLKKKTCAT